jgi:hypothetical protein
MEDEPIKFIAKKNCKDCYGSGFLTRTTSMGTERGGRKKDDKKVMSKHKTLCHCAKELKEPKPDECVVPKVADELKDPNGVMAVKTKTVHYASNAIPDGGEG